MFYFYPKLDISKRIQHNNIRYNFLYRILIFHNYNIIAFIYYKKKK